SFGYTAPSSAAPVTAPARAAIAYSLPSPMLTKMGPGHIPAIDQPTPNSSPPRAFPRLSGFTSIAIGAPVIVRPYFFKSSSPVAVQATAVPMIPYNWNDVNKNIDWMKL